jgi:hypothetical protein
VNSWAMRTRSSSSATVVLMALIVASHDVICRAYKLGDETSPPQAKLGRGTLESVVNVEA